MEIDNFMYLGATSIGDTWRFNFRDKIVKFRGNIPVSTYSNWLQREAIPADVPEILCDVLLDHSLSVKSAYQLHTFGIDLNAGVLTSNEILYKANIEELVDDFLRENIQKIISGHKIYVGKEIKEREYSYKYSTEPKAKKSKSTSKVSNVEEVIYAYFDVNFFALSLDENQNWDSYSIDVESDLNLQILFLRQNLLNFIFELCRVKY